MGNNLELSMSEQLKITDGTIERWKELFEITDDDVDCLRDCSATIIKNLDSIINEFYDWQVAQPEAAAVIGDRDTLDRLRDAMRVYIREIFEGYFDLLYVNKRLRIGRVHHRISVTPMLYMASMRKLLEILIDHIGAQLGDEASWAQHRRSEAALAKILSFDSQIVFSTYILGLTAQVERSNAFLTEQAEKLSEKVAKKTERLNHLSMRDPLTGLYNRRAFLDSLRRDLAMAERSDQPVSLVFIDVNRFKELNDTEGHVVGDALLRTLAQTMTRAARDTDTVCRYGGDEFCAILPRAAAEDARIYCQRILDFFDKEKKGDISLSIGIAQSGPEIKVEKDTLVASADKAMYQAKSDTALRPEHKIVCYKTPVDFGPNVTKIVSSGLPGA